MQGFGRFDSHARKAGMAHSVRDCYWDMPGQYTRNQLPQGITDKQEVQPDSQRSVKFLSHVSDCSMNVGVTSRDCCFKRESTVYVGHQSRACTKRCHQFEVFSNEAARNVGLSPRQAGVKLNAACGWTVQSQRPPNCPCRKTPNSPSAQWDVLA